MSRAAKILAQLSEVVRPAFGDLMGQFLKYMDQTKLVDSVLRQKYHDYETVDITVTDGDVFTIDLVKDGFHWVDFGVDKHLGKQPKEAAAVFKKMLDGGLYSMSLGRKK